MPRRKKDLSSATYLDELGTKSANAYAPIILKQISEMGARCVFVELPLSSSDLATLLDKTIKGLIEQGKLDWDHLTNTRAQVFIEAWYSTMQRKGLA